MSNFIFPELTDEDKQMILGFVYDNDQEGGMKYLSELAYEVNREKPFDKTVAFVEGVVTGIHLSHQIHMWFLYEVDKNRKSKGEKDNG